MIKRNVIIAVWLGWTAAAVVCAAMGNLDREWVVLVGFLAAVSISYGVARLVALSRIAMDLGSPGRFLSQCAGA